MRRTEEKIQIRNDGTCNIFLMAPAFLFLRNSREPISPLAYRPGRVRLLPNLTQRLGRGLALPLQSGDYTRWIYLELSTG
jgi:hypothetical protein